MLARSFLFAPGNHARRSEKALGLGADAVILDLEDACPVAEKVAARDAVVAALGRPRASRGYVRVNALSTPFAHGDLMSVVAAGVDGIILPKAERPDDLRTAEWMISQLEAERGLEPGAIDLIPIVETARGFAHLQDIALSGTRVRRIAFGAGDFTLDLGLEWSRGEAELLPHRSALVLISRAAGLEPPVDTVWTDLRDPDGFAASAEAARALGFQGKLCIHPDQVAVVNAAFTPTDAQLGWARKVVAAFDEAEARGSASIQVDGQFIDYPIVERARRIVALAERIAGSGDGSQSRPARPV